MSNRRKRYASSQFATILDGTNQTWQKTSPSGISFERTTAFSVVMYFKVNSIIGANDLFIGCKKGDATLRGWHVAYSATNKILISLVNSNSGTAIVSGTTTNNNVFSLGRYFVFVGTYDGSSLNTGFKIYVDGVSQAVTGANTLSATTVTDASFCIGSRDNTDRWANITVGLAQVVSGYVLTQAEISNIQNNFRRSGLPKSYGGGSVIANYDWRAQGRDISGTGNDLAPVNSPQIIKI